MNLPPSSSIFKMPIHKQSPVFTKDFHIVNLAQHSNILELKKLLYDKKFDQIETKINEFIYKILGAEAAFIMYPTHEICHLGFRVFNETVLPQPMQIKIARKLILDAIFEFKGFHTHKIGPQLEYHLHHFFHKWAFSLACIPIRFPETVRKAAAMVFVLNRNCSKFKRATFRNRDIQDIHKIFGHIYKVHLYKNHQLNVIDQVIFTMGLRLGKILSSKSKMLKVMCIQLRNIINCQSCTLYIVDEKKKFLTIKVFGKPKNREIPTYKNKARISLKVEATPCNSFLKNSIINVQRKDQLNQWDLDLDIITGYSTKNMLCFPIFNCALEAMGVLELTNKIQEPFFSNFDVEMTKNHAIGFGQLL